MAATTERPGATAVHDFGGLVIASDGESSEDFGLPETAILRQYAVDHVVPVEGIAELLVSPTTAGS